MHASTNASLADSISVNISETIPAMKRLNILNSKWVNVDVFIPQTARSGPELRKKAGVLPSNPAPRFSLFFRA